MLKRVLDAAEHPTTRGLDLDSPELTARRRDIIREKPFLQAIYDDWYTRIIGALPDPHADVLELGSGAGFLNEYLPGVIESEVFHVGGVDAVLDGTLLPFRDGSLDAVVMTDVFHHIPRVDDALRETARCVRGEGRLIMIEPWNTPFASLIYRYLHHEPFQPDTPTWHLPAGGPLSGANGALPWVVFVRDRATFQRQFPEWELVTLQPFMPFRYLLSGGVSKRALVPHWTYPAWVRLEDALAPLAPQLAMFALIVLRRRP